VDAVKAEGIVDESISVIYVVACSLTGDELVGSEFKMVQAALA
jgi:hypothetical protein